ncbi:MAG: class I SAM-dependent methyltransferase [Rubrobacteraceae bacterium]
MEDQREKWDEIFHRIGYRTPDRSSWLERWEEILESSRGIPILELGCGGGQDTRFLVERGFPVIATDFSEEALKLTRRNAPEAEVRHLDMTRGLPFPSESFQVVVASLCLHYFPWRETVGIAAEIHRCLKPNGFLLVRLNSRDDEFYKSAEKQRIEENFYLVDGMPKRLFDRKSLEALFAEGWKIASAEERTTGRFGGAKTLWEIAVKKLTG